MAVVPLKRDLLDRGERNRYFPSIRTILFVRFDDHTKDKFDLDEIRIENDPDPFLASRRRQKQRDLTGQPRQLETGPLVFSSTNFRAALTNARVNIADAVAQLPRPDGLSRIIDVSPSKSSRRINSYRFADELDLTIPWKAAPFDSRIIRSIMIFHYEGTTIADAFASGEREQAPDVPNPTGFIVPATGDNLRFVGIADTISDVHGDGDVITIKARDLTALLIDTDVPPSVEVRIPAGATIAEAIRILLDTNDAFELIRGPFLRIQGGLPKLSPDDFPRLAVPPKERNRRKKTINALKAELRTDVEELESIQEIVAQAADPIAALKIGSDILAGIEEDISLLNLDIDRINRQLVRVRKAGFSGAYVIQYPPSLGKTTYWDAITSLCVSHGLRPSIEQDKLVLLEPRTLYKRTPELVTQSGVATFPRPGGHRVQIGDTRHNVRRMVYGINVLNLRFHRKLAGVKVPTVEVVSRNSDAVRADRRQIKVRFPPKVVVNDIDAAGKKPQEKFHRVEVRGLVDESRALEIARQVYEGMGRQELGIAFTTDDVASFSDHDLFDPNLDPDLLDLRAGDPIQLLVTPTERQRSKLFSLAELNLLVARNRNLADRGASELSGAIEFLVSQGWKEGDARQLVKILNTANLPSEFRVVSAQVSFDGEGSGGFQIQIDARDYVRARADPDDFAQTGGPGKVVSGDKVGSLPAGGRPLEG